MNDIIMAIIVLVGIVGLYAWATLEGDTPFSKDSKGDVIEISHVGFMVVDHTEGTYVDEVFTSYMEAALYMDWLQKVRISHTFSVRPVDGLN